MRIDNRVVTVQITKADEEATKHILALYHNEQTPELIKSAIFRLFLDYHNHHNWPLPNNFPEQWEHLWPCLLARAREAGNVVTAIRYTWQPTSEEEAKLDEHDDLLKEADVIFDLMNGEGLPDGFQNNFRESIADLLYIAKVDVYNERHLWQEAWQLVSERLAIQEKLERDTE
jgi:hypothetical protein